MQPASDTPYCSFEGPFTRNEQACLYLILSALEKATDLPRADAGPTWHVQRDEEYAESGDPDPLPLRAQHADTGTEISGRSVDRFLGAVEKVVVAVRPVNKPSDPS